MAFLWRGNSSGDETTPSAVSDENQYALCDTIEEEEPKKSKKKKKRKDKEESPEKLRQDQQRKLDAEYERRQQRRSSLSGMPSKSANVREGSRWRSSVNNGSAIDFGHHGPMVEALRYSVWDLVALSAEDKSFHQLKRSLRKNGAVTNEMLKQGLPLFLHKNRGVILKRYFQEMDRQDLLEAKEGEVVDADILRANTNGAEAVGGDTGNGGGNFVERAMEFTFPSFWIPPAG